jgi:hypothetical protein
LGLWLERLTANAVVAIVLGIDLSSSPTQWNLRGAADEAVLNIELKKKNPNRVIYTVVTDKCSGMRDIGRAVKGYGGSFTGRKQPNFNISKLIKMVWSQKIYRLLTKLKIKKKHYHDFITIKCYVRTEPVFVNLLRIPGTDSSESIPGLHKRLQIRALYKK